MRAMEEGFMMSLGFRAFLDIGGSQAANPEVALCPS
jgi:hypothetical protein